ncbi:MAG: hypothetical protein NPIRA04_27380 [Nitrospirales bacterium]|nr:MAG: hypothetical protein NPIRA04_27380 [Nitrospirales bacterium]
MCLLNAVKTKKSKPLKYGVFSHIREDYTVIRAVFNLESSAQDKSRPRIFMERLIDDWMRNARELCSKNLRLGWDYKLQRMRIHVESLEKGS